MQLNPPAAQPSPPAGGANPAASFSSNASGSTLGVQARPFSNIVFSSLRYSPIIAVRNIPQHNSDHSSPTQKLPDPPFTRVGPCRGGCKASSAFPPAFPWVACPIFSPRFEVLFFGPQFLEKNPTFNWLERLFGHLLRIATFYTGSGFICIPFFLHRSTQSAYRAIPGSPFAYGLFPTAAST